METDKRSIGIVGGGLLGMTLALRLSERGFDVSIIESTSNLGGLAAPYKIGDYTWDRFYHVILMSDSNLLGIIEELDLKDEIKWGETKTGFFADGRLHSMSNIMEFLTFPPLKLIDKLRLGITIFYASRLKSWQRLERISVTDWLTRLSGKRTFKKIWLPLLKSKLGDDYKITSASFIWAVIARMYAARRSGLKQEMFGYVDGGYSTVIRRFQDFLLGKGIEILCDEPIARVQNNGRGVDIESGPGRMLSFDDVVVTIPCTQIPHICPKLSSSEKQRLNDVTYQGVLCAALILKRPLAGHYITNITDEWVPFTAVIEMTALVNKEYFDGNSLVYLPLYLSQGDPFWQKSDEEVRDEFLLALEKMYPSFHRDDIVATELSKARTVLPITTLNYSSQLLPPTRTSLQNVFVVNSSQIANGTMNVNELVGLANRKATEIAQIISS